MFAIVKMQFERKFSDNEIFNLFTGVQLRTISKKKKKKFN